MPAPIILAGTTDAGKRFVQFWTEHHKVAGQQVTHLMAEMNAGEHTFGAPLLRINPEIDPAWVDVVLDTFARFRTGNTVTPTHTVAWEFGAATFTPVEPFALEVP